MDKHTAICLLPGSAAPMRMSHSPVKRERLFGKDFSASINARISLSDDRTRTEGGRARRALKSGWDFLNKTGE